MRSGEYQWHRQQSSPLRSLGIGSCYNPDADRSSPLDLIGSGCKLIDRLVFAAIVNAVWRRKIGHECRNSWFVFVASSTDQDVANIAYVPLKLVFYSFPSNTSE